jgi:transposase
MKTKEKMAFSLGSVRDEVLEKRQGISEKFRDRRMELFLKLVDCIPRPVTLLDVGGTVTFWRDRIPEGFSLTLINDVVSAGRQALPDHLPCIEYRHEPESCTCGQCGNTLVKIGEDVTEQLDVEPAQFFVHRHIRPQYACRACETVTAAPIPPAVIEGGMAAVGLLSWVMISKYLDHLPLYRLEQIAARDGVTLSRSTLADWVGRLGVALEPLANRLAWHLLQRDCLHADETPVPQLDPGNGKTKKAYLWAYRSNDL